MLCFGIDSYGQSIASIIDLGAKNFLSTDKTKEIADAYKSAEKRIAVLKAEINNLKAESQKSKEAEDRQNRKNDTLNALTSYQAALLVERNAIISQLNTIIETKDEIIADKDRLIKKQILQLKEKDSIIIEYESQRGNVALISRPEKRDIVTFYGQSFKANETIMWIELDDKNKPIIKKIDSIKLTLLYSYAIQERRHLVFTSTKNINTTEFINSSVTGRTFEDSYMTQSYSDILKSYSINVLNFVERSIEIDLVHTDQGRRVSVSLSKKR